VEGGVRARHQGPQGALLRPWVNMHPPLRQVPGKPTPTAPHGRSPPSSMEATGGKAPEGHSPLATRLHPPWLSSALWGCLIVKEALPGDRALLMPQSHGDGGSAGVQPHRLSVCECACGRACVHAAGAGGPTSRRAAVSRACLSALRGGWKRLTLSFPVSLWWGWGLQPRGSGLNIHSAGVGWRGAALPLTALLSQTSQHQSPQPCHVH
jgi:hypothetical protein